MIEYIYKKCILKNYKINKINKCNIIYKICYNNNNNVKMRYNIHI